MIVRVLSCLRPVFVLASCEEEVGGVKQCLLKKCFKRWTEEFGLHLASQRVLVESISRGMAECKWYFRKINPTKVQRMDWNP